MNKIHSTLYDKSRHGMGFLKNIVRWQEEIWRTYAGIFERRRISTLRVTRNLHGQPLVSCVYDFYGKSQNPLAPSARGVGLLIMGIHTVPKLCNWML